MQTNEAKAPGPAMRRSPAEDARLAPYYATNQACQDALARRGYDELWRVPGRAVPPAVAAYHAATSRFTEDPQAARLLLETLTMRLDVGDLALPTQTVA